MEATTTTFKSTSIATALLVALAAYLLLGVVTAHADGSMRIPPCRTGSSSGRGSSGCW